MNLYEKIMILDSGLDDKAVEETVGKVRDKITGQGGEILKTENWGSRKLAYELNKHQKGIYILLLFKSPPSTIAELERFSRVTDSIVKIMVVRLQKKKQIEAVMASLAKAETEAKAEETISAQEPAAPADEEKETGNETSGESKASEEEDK